MLGGRHPVGVNGLDVSGVWLALPARHETCCDRRAFIDDSLRDRRLVDAPCGLRDIGQRHHRCPGQLLAGGGVVDVEQRRISPDGRQHRQAGLDVDAHIAGVNRQRERFSRRQPAAEVAVHQQRPHIAEGDPLTYQVFDVDATVAQGPAVFVRLGDLGRKGHHAVEAGDEILRDHCHTRILTPGPGNDATGWGQSRCRR
ncbi:Uncharacterised protein [Mycobacterium tuberculosis]|nr:Uncharacterised protein [Mycobacterium tuberculosis]